MFGWLKSFFAPFFLVAPSFAADSVSCEDIPAGGAVLVQQSIDQSPTRLPRLYQLERDAQSPHIYHVYVPIDFLVEDSDYVEEELGPTAMGYLSPNDLLEQIVPGAVLDPMEEKLVGQPSRQAFLLATSHLETRMFVRARDCLASFHGQLVSPDGLDLRIHATMARRLRLDPSHSNQVEVIANLHRSNAVQWADDISCPVILHEVLHLMGLVDGYPETGEFDFSCRHYEPPSSIMTNSSSADTLYHYLVCPIQDQDVSRPQIRQVPSPEALVCQGDRKALLGNWHSLVSARSLHSSSVIYRPVERTGPLLYPAHYRFITRPFCREDSRRYITCAQNAYLSSAQSCIPTPDYCADGSYLEGP